MSKLAIVYKQVPDRELFNNSFKDDVEVYNNEDASIYTTYNEIKDKTYDRVALVWKYNGKYKCPIISRFYQHPYREIDRKTKNTFGQPFSIRLKELLISLKEKNDNFNALKINNLTSSIKTLLNSYNHVVPLCIANSLVIAPYTVGWAMEIFNNTIGSASDSISLSDLSSSDQSSLITLFNNYYDTNVTSGFDFTLYNGSVLASTIDLSCFCGLTEILTVNNGYIDVESLKIGEELITKKGKKAKITKILKIKHKGEIIKIKKDKFGKGIPFKEFNITPDHKMCPKGKRWHYPKGKKRIVDEIILYHIETDNYKDCSIMANGIAVETWKPQNLETQLITK
jgi:hypothetical protein